MYPQLSSYNCQRVGALARGGKTLQRICKLNLPAHWQYALAGEHVASWKVRIELSETRASIIMRKANELGIIFNSLVSHLHSCMRFFLFFLLFFFALQRSLDIYAPFVFIIYIVYIPYIFVHSCASVTDAASGRWALYFYSGVFLMCMIKLLIFFQACFWLPAGRGLFAKEVHIRV